MFYRLYLNHTTYRFSFSKNDHEVAYIQLECAPQTPKSATGHFVHLEEFTDEEIVGFVRLSHDMVSLNMEAWDMTREYLQGHSGTLPKHDQYGQELFHMDIDSFNDLRNNRA